MFKIEFMDPYLLWVWVPLIAGLVLAIAAYNTRVLDGVRALWGDRLLLGHFSPRNKTQSRVLWAQWTIFVTILMVALAGPNISQAPEMVPQGAVQVEFVYDVSPSQGAEEYRGFLPAPPGQAIPDKSFQWGTRLDAAKHFTRQLMPQIANNQAGLITVEGAGYNMWDITTDLSPTGAFHHMLNKFVQVGAAPGAGCDFTSGLNAALDEFQLISALQKKAGDTTEKIRFIVFFSDGGFTGDVAELDKVLAKMKQQNVRLLIVGLGGNQPVTVPRYNPTTHRRELATSDRGHYPGLTKLETKMLTHMRDRVPGSELILAPPGTDAIKYSFPQKAGGLYARPVQANLKVWFLLVDLLLLLTITTGGGGWPRWRMLVPDLKAIKNAGQGVALSLQRSRSLSRNRQKDESHD